MVMYHIKIQLYDDFLTIGSVINQRVAYIERNWPYFLGFGLPLSVVTALPSSLVIR